MKELCCEVNTKHRCTRCDLKLCKDHWRKEGGYQMYYREMSKQELKQRSKCTGPKGGRYLNHRWIRIRTRI